MTLATVQSATGIVQMVPAMEELVLAAETPEQVKDALDDVDQFETFAKRFGVDNLAARISAWRIDLRRKRAEPPMPRGGLGGTAKIQDEFLPSQVDRTRDRQLAAVPEQEYQEMRQQSIETDTPLTVSGVISRARHLEQGTGNNERYTPAYILDAVRAVMGDIELDPASSDAANETVKAQRYFTVEQDALGMEWDAESLWLNPPYGRGEIEAFADKLSAECERGVIDAAMVLTHNATETQWFRTILRQSVAFCFLHKRVDFDTPGDARGGGTLRGQVLFFLGNDSEGLLESFATVFKQLGEICRPFRT